MFCVTAYTKEIFIENKYSSHLVYVSLYDHGAYVA